MASQMTQQHYRTYDADFKENFDPYNYTTRTQVGMSFARTQRMETPEYTGYLAWLADENNDRVERIKAGCRIVEAMGAFVPTVIISDDWLAVQEFDGVETGGWPEGTFPEEVLTFASRVNKESLMWDSAKMIIAGHCDAIRKNFMVDSDGEFVHIDLQSLGIPVTKDLKWFLEGIDEKSKLVGEDEEEVEAIKHGIELRTISLAVFLEETDFLGDLEHPFLRENIETVKDIFPRRNPDATVEELSLLEVDETVLPME